MLHATDLAAGLAPCDLLITDTKVAGVEADALVEKLRKKQPGLPIVYLANIDRSTPAFEAKLPRNVPILREPFTADQLREVVGSLLAGNQDLAVDAGG